MILMIFLWDANKFGEILALIIVRENVYEQIDITCGTNRQKYYPDKTSDCSSFHGVGVFWWLLNWSQLAIPVSFWVTGSCVPLNKGIVRLIREEMLVAKCSSDQW